MSGGVDSSLAAALLAEAGYEVTGISMKLWSQQDQDFPSYHPTCCSAEAVDDAHRVCRILGIPFYYLNFEEHFRSQVVDYFCEEYLRGRTPNPCLACNERIKFDLLLRKTLAMGADYLATGHYARIEEREGRYLLLRALDRAKDQSYVLYCLGQHQLKHLLFPIGAYRKAEVRRMAAERRLPVADKAESQEICFIPDSDYRKFLAQRFPAEPGDIVDSRGRVLGRHRGLASYTIGQRRGLGVAMGERLFVLGLDSAANKVVIGPNEQLMSYSLIADGATFVSGEVPLGPVSIQAKVRYRSPAAQALLLPFDGRWQVRFQEPQRAITPGQAVVFYRGEEVLGGGIIA
jgi:tRNA-specific 2-thiouridylase